MMIQAVSKLAKVSNGKITEPRRAIIMFSKATELKGKLADE